MRFLNWFFGVILTLVLTEVVGDTFGDWLFRSGLLGSYDTALPLSIVVSFGISVACVVVLFRWWHKYRSSKKNEG
jgi:hypothetical protein